MKRRSRTRQARRSRAPQPPLQAARTYSDAVARWLEGFQAWCLDRIVDTWSQNEHHNPYPGHHDAKGQGFTLQVEYQRQGPPGTPGKGEWFIRTRVKSETAAEREIEILAKEWKGVPTRIKPYQGSAKAGDKSIYSALEAPVVIPPPLGDWIDARIGEFHVALAERFEPGSALSKTLKTVAARVDKKSGLEFQRTIGIPTKAVSKSGSLEAWRTKNVDLITSLSKQGVEDLRPILEHAEENALRVEDLSKNILERFDVTKSKADLLARDQTLKLNGQLNQERQQNAGIEKYIWTSSNDERVRPIHAELDGTTQEWNNPPVEGEDGQTGHPGSGYQCRCTADPILPGIDDA